MSESWLSTCSLLTYLLLLTYSYYLAHSLTSTLYAAQRQATPRHSPSIHAFIHLKQINASPTAFRSNGGQRAAFAHTQHKRVALVPNPRNDKEDSLS